MSSLHEDTRKGLAGFMARHDKVALLFSGGKDSIACLQLLRPFIEKVTVIWANPGDPYPETVTQMAQLRDNVPRFIEARGDVMRFHQDFGYPVDMLPFESSPVGRLTAGNEPEPKLVLLDACCNQNMWRPLFEALEEAGVTGCVRGDKRSDPWRPRFESGANINGHEYHLPLMEWADADVFEFIGDMVPTSYRRGHHTSFDCMSCTAYVLHNAGRFRELGEFHPLKFNPVQKVLWHMRQKTFDYLSAIVKEGL